MDIGISKMTGAGASGSGIVAKAKFLASTNVTSDQIVTFSLNDISASNSAGNTIQISASTLNVTIKAITTIDVWPGDCNNDKIVNSSDIIPIGLFYGQTRNTSNSTGSIWQPYAREPWTADSGTPKRIFADANGDGTINSADIIPIGLNYSKVHSSIRNNDLSTEEKLEKTVADPTIVPVCPTKLKNNTKFTVSVKIGDPNQISNLYGLSFKLKSNKATCTYIDGSAKEGSFLGNNVLTFFRKVDDQTVDIAVTKNSIPGNSGSGIIASADFISSVDQTVSFSLVDVSATNDKGNSITLNVQSTSILVGINEYNSRIPDEFLLFQNYPNPFNPTTTIKYELPQGGLVNLKVYDVLGNEAATLVNQDKAAGRYEINFDASKLSSGVYFYKLSSGSFSSTKKFILMR